MRISNFINIVLIKNRSHRGRSTWGTLVALVAALLALLVLPRTLRAQAVSNPNQIIGTIEFSNTNPAILNILNSTGEDEGFTSGVVTAASAGISPQLNNSTSFATSNRTSTSYEVTVESGPPGNGIAYGVNVDMRLDQNSDRYRFSPIDTGPVEEEPAPDVVANASECAGMFDIRWVTPTGSPVSVNSGVIQAFRETSPGSGSFQFQARANLNAPGGNQEFIAVRGDSSLYRINIRFTTGTDAFSDTITFEHEAFQTSSCDEITEIVCEIPEGGGGGDLGAIVGVVDMLGENEHSFSTLTQMTADSGPFGNSRFDTVSLVPSSGNFELENLVPSDATIPAAGYRTFGTMIFRTDRRTQWFRTPFLESLNGRVLVEAGQVTDLGDTFVLDPGLVSGEIFLQGPTPAQSVGSCLQDVSRSSDVDSNGDGIPNNFTIGNSRINGFGQNTLASGATMTAIGGSARVGFEGDFQSSDAAFSGDYEMVLGGLLQERSLWQTNSTWRFLDTATPTEPQSFQNSTITITNQDVGVLEVVPGQNLVVPVRHCFGQLNLGFVTTSGTFFNPRVAGTGAFSGDDFESTPANYTLSANANGLPNNSGDSDSQGSVVMCLPEGVYNFTPFVNSLNPGGGTSTTELPPVTVTVGCSQVIDVTLGLQVTLDAVSSCSEAGSLTLTGSATSTGDTPVVVRRIFATVNGGSPIEFCSDCGEDPQFDFDVPLQACGNTVVVTAEDEFGNVSSTQATTSFDATPPELTGCDDLDADVDPELGGANVTFDVTSNDGCEGERAVECDSESGELFAEGVTTVSCSSTDACGNSTSCTFDITVGAEAKPKHEHKHKHNKRKHNKRKHNKRKHTKKAHRHGSSWHHGRTSGHRHSRARRSKGRHRSGGQ